MSVNNLTLERAYRLIKNFVYFRSNSSETITEEVKLAAMFVVENEVHLPAFFPEKFCIAVCCELDFEIQRQHAWFLVSDMLNGDSSWITSINGYSIERALRKAGLIPEKDFDSERLRLGPVRFNSSDLLKSIIEKYNLPTHRLHPDKLLTQEEKEEKLLFNTLYSAFGGNECVL